MSDLQSPTPVGLRYEQRHQAIWLVHLKSHGTLTLQVKDLLFQDNMPLFAYFEEVNFLLPGTALVDNGIDMELRVKAEKM